MRPFDTTRLPVQPTAIAPDLSRVRVLLRLDGGSMAHFELPAGQVSAAVEHRGVEEIWFFLSGHGEMWRRQGAREELVDVEKGVCISVPLGTQFQFRNVGEEALCAVAITMPPWPGDEEAVAVAGRWPATRPD
jgi:mannose-6-phosphate isomerase-like protein (cupin superfamily)